VGLKVIYHSDFSQPQVFSQLNAYKAALAVIRVYDGQIHFSPPFKETMMLLRNFFHLMDISKVRLVQPAHMHSLLS
jgi:hypothetical protein